jgi:ABC-type polysaccharide/polyol phosphate transport system ATPase subunit
MPDAMSPPALTSDSLGASAATGGAPAAITVAGVSKTFRLPRRRYSTFKERALHPFASQDMHVLRALDDVSVEIPQGEFFGIVGRNGSGKSTLLKCLAGIYGTDQGHIRVEGKLSPFIELGVGFNADLTARDNVLINAILLGLSRREARARFDDIIAFAELEEFLDLKLKNYSSGMHVRLAFAVATQADADVLLVDEVLAVGDAAFQQKCFEQFHKLKDAGRTIVFVTHDMQAVERFCDRAMLIERGRVVDIGDPHQIARAYNEINFGRLVHDSPAGPRYGDQAAAEIAAAWFENAAGERIEALAQGESLQIAMEVRFHATLDAPIFGLTLRNVVGHTIFATRTDYRGVATGRYEAGDVATIRVALENWLAPSDYRLTPSIARAGAGTEALDLREDLAHLTVHGTGNSGGVVDTPHEIDIERR